MVILRGGGVLPRSQVRPLPGSIGKKPRQFCLVRVGSTSITKSRKKHPPSVPTQDEISQLLTIGSTTFCRSGVNKVHLHLGTSYLVQNNGVP